MGLLKLWLIALVVSFICMYIGAFDDKLIVFYVGFSGLIGCILSMVGLCFFSSDWKKTGFSFISVGVLVWIGCFCALMLEDYLAQIVAI